VEGPGTEAAAAGLPVTARGIEHDNARSFYIGKNADPSIKDEEEMQDDAFWTPEIADWAEFSKILNCDPPRTNFAIVASFLKKEAEVWINTGAGAKPAKGWAALLARQLPALLKAEEGQPLSEHTLRAWAYVMTLLGMTGEAANTVDPLLTQTAGSQ
jgi:hypothetical protein